MKKLITLLMFSLIGITQTWAWGDMYLICKANSNWANSGDSYKQNAFKFTYLSEYHYRATVPGSYITSESWYFRFRDSSSDTWTNIRPESNSDDANITSTTVSTGWSNADNGTAKSFYIAQNASAKYVHIFCTWNTSTEKWDVSCSIITEQTEYTVAYTNPCGWDAENVKVYAFLDGVTLTNAWPGNTMTYSNNIYTATITGAPNSKLIFSNNGNDGTKSSELDLANNTVYNSTSAVTSQSVGVSASYTTSTYSSEYPLDFSEVDGIQAYVVTGVDGEGMLTTVKVSKDGETAGKKVPANTGLLITADAVSTSVDVPTTVSTDDIGTNWLKPGTGEIINQVEAGVGTNYILTNKRNGDTEANAPLKFYKVNGTSGNTVPTNRAYLQIPLAVTAPEFFNFDFDFSTPTGVGATLIENREWRMENYYDLQGRRVTQPTKGLYIVNGKKVVLK